MAEHETHTSIPDPTTWNTVTGVSENISLEGDTVEKLASLGARATGITLYSTALDDLGLDGRGLPSAVPFAVVHGERPELRSVKNLVEEWREHPERRVGVAVVGDVASLCDLINRQKTEHSVVFAESDWKKPSLTAVIDYHALDALEPADFGRHRIHYAFPFSDEWVTWLANDGKVMDQAKFAEFIEERLPDLVTLVEAENAHHAREMQVKEIGAPSQIFELARGLEINVGGKVKQNIKLQSGEAKIVFEEEHTGRDGQPIAVPGAFALSIPLFYNEEPITIPVRLRYRVAGGSIVWIYKLYRIDRIVAEAVNLAKAEVRDQTNLAVYEGAPEMLADGRPVSIAEPR